MGFGNTNAAAGGTSLNFEVVGGTTEPTNPKEIMIWVYTSIKITGWHFTATQPENMAEGEVWFLTGDSPDLAFNALKKNAIKVYPLAAKQYVSGTLKEVSAKIYQSGKWNEFINEIYLYDKGVIHNAAGSLVKTSVPYKKGTGGDCHLNINNDHVIIGTWGGGSSLVHFSNKIDLTNHKTLYFNGSFYRKNTQYDASCGIGVWKSIPTTDAGAAASAIMEGYRAEDTHSLDISSCTGEHYVGIVVHGYGGSGDGYAEAKMNQLYLK